MRLQSQYTWGSCCRRCLRGCRRLCWLDHQLLGLVGGRPYGLLTVLALGGPEDGLDGVHERMGTLAAGVLEVVQIQGPDHAAAQPQLTDKLRLERLWFSTKDGADQ